MCDPLLRVDNENDLIRFVDGDMRLLANRLLKQFFRFGNKTAGVDQRKRLSAPLCGCIMTVARHSWLVVHDGILRADNAIK